MVSCTGIKAYIYTIYLLVVTLKVLAYTKALYLLEEQFNVVHIDYSVIYFLLAINKK